MNQTTINSIARATAESIFGPGLLPVDKDEQSVFLAVEQIYNLLRHRDRLQVLTGESRIDATNSILDGRRDLGYATRNHARFPINFVTDEALNNIWEHEKMDGKLGTVEHVCPNSITLRSTMNDFNSEVSLTEFASVFLSRSMVCLVSKSQDRRLGEAGLAKDHPDPSVPFSRYDSVGIVPLVCKFTTYGFEQRLVRDVKIAKVNKMTKEEWKKSVLTK
jgi:hypothetical protein